MLEGIKSKISNLSFFFTLGNLKEEEIESKAGQKKRNNRNQSRKAMKLKAGNQ